MIINDIITAIVENLNDEFSIDELKVENYPENFEEYELSHPNGAILILAGDSNLNEPSVTGFQTGILEILITVVAKKLYDANGIYLAEDRVKDSLKVLRFDTSKLYLTTKTKPIFTKEGFWISEMTFILPQITFEEE